MKNRTSVSAISNPHNLTGRLTETLTFEGQTQHLGPVKLSGGWHSHVLATLPPQELGPVNGVAHLLTYAGRVLQPEDNLTQLGNLWYT